MDFYDSVYLRIHHSNSCGKESKEIHLFFFAEYISHALIASLRKITVFLFAVIVLAIFAGSFINVVEGHENGFTSTPYLPVFIGQLLHYKW